jgi:hypothetical protein
MNTPTKYPLPDAIEPCEAMRTSVGEEGRKFLKEADEANPTTKRAAILSPITAPKGWEMVEGDE